MQQHFNDAEVTAFIHLCEMGHKRRFQKYQLRHDLGDAALRSSSMMVEVLNPIYVIPHSQDKRRITLRVNLLKH
jgi:hypothetical protein